MTEPVAYMWKTAGGNVLGFQEYKDTTPYPGYATPLYTAEQLHPRVKMTQAEFDEFNSLNEQFTILGVLSYVWEHKDTKIGKLFLCRELELAQLWSDFDRDHPEETIEIVPDMKWFVRSKESDKDGYYWWLTYNGSNFAPEYMPKKNASSLIKSFYTKEEAELWVNPLTEAVQLPVEGE